MGVIIFVGKIECKSFLCSSDIQQWRMIKRDYNFPTDKEGNKITDVLDMSDEQAQRLLQKL